MLVDSKYSHGIIINAIYGKKGLPSVLPKAADVTVCQRVQYEAQV